ncbi:MAG: sigma-54-dependent Fis family transcriptional regulator [Candidatus Marinimicrobia bacterium]|nr:sigma-54-dependent Fis family transcriptional regulator [Candidatus Neomarinimicrobiota bacterium]
MLSNNHEKVLIVDDNHDTRSNIEELLRLFDFETDSAANGRQALEKVRTFDPSCLVLDLKLPEIDGWGVMESLKREIENGLIIIVITAFGDVSSAVKAVKAGAYDFIEKPFNNEVLLLSINRAISNSKVKKELKKLKRSIGQCGRSDEIFGKSPAITKMLKQLEPMAKTNISIMIHGETGSGKEVVANYIHSISERHDKPFVTVDCGAIPENLIESELFGYEKGAFTGAVKSTMGKFQAAHGGTLFLDEIGNLPLQQQRTILRAVEQKTITPVGSNEAIKVDTRLFCATNDDLAQKVFEGTFREDLFYRISEFVIYIPPLRQRLEDFPVIVNSFIEQYGEELNSKIQGITHEAMKALRQFNWPGNVRQLRNTIRRAMVLADDEIKVEHLQFPRQITKGIDYDNIIKEILNSDPPVRNKIREVNEIIEAKVLEELMIINNNNISKVSNLFGTDRKSIYAKLEHLGLNEKLK